MHFGLGVGEAKGESQGLCPSASLESREPVGGGAGSAHGRFGESTGHLWCDAPHSVRLSEVVCVQSVTALVTATRASAVEWVPVACDR